MTAASRSLATALLGSALRERLAPAELHHQLGHDQALPLYAFGALLYVYSLRLIPL